MVPLQDILKELVGRIMTQTLPPFPYLKAIAVAEAHRVIHSLTTSTLLRIEEDMQQETDELYTHDPLFYLKALIKSAQKRFDDKSDVFEVTGCGQCVTQDSVMKWLEEDMSSAKSEAEGMDALLSA